MVTYMIVDVDRKMSTSSSTSKALRKATERRFSDGSYPRLEEEKRLFHKLVCFSFTDTCDSVCFESPNKAEAESFGGPKPQQHQGHQLTKSRSHPKKMSANQQVPQSKDDDEDDEDEDESEQDAEVAPGEDEQYYEGIDFHNAFEVRVVFFCYD
jgi:hypothetical protein